MTSVAPGQVFAEERLKHDLLIQIFSCIAILIHSHFIAFDSLQSLSCHVQVH